MPKTRSSGIEIAYDDLGKGEPALLLMPDWCTDRTVFEDIAMLCAKQRRTLVLDWRGHGQSGTPPDDFGEEDLVEDALSVIAASGARRVVPVALAHAGWVALELRRRMESAIPRLALIDWIVREPPPAFLEILQGLQDRRRWRDTADRLLASWLHGTDNPRLARFLREVAGSYGFGIWSRAARSIGEAYSRHGTPLKALSRLSPHVPTLHLCARSEDPGHLEAQQAFAAKTPWFHVLELPASSHFPMFEVPAEMTSRIVEFTTWRSRRAA
jgi:pimeloyl-ACP methyl ester carboxylesterase